MIIRRAHIQDLAEVRAVLIATWHATYDATYGAARVTEITDSWHALANLERQLADEAALRLVAVDEHRIVGTANATLSQHAVVRLHQLYVLPQIQGRGIGKALLLALLDHWPQAACVSLEVDPHNKLAISFYEAQGFIKTGENPNDGNGDADMRTLVYERKVLSHGWK